MLPRRTQPRPCRYRPPRVRVPRRIPLRGRTRAMTAVRTCRRRLMQARRGCSHRGLPSGARPCCMACRCGKRRCSLRKRVGPSGMRASGVGLGSTALTHLPAEAGVTHPPAYGIVMDQDDDKYVYPDEFGFDVPLALGGTEIEILASPTHAAAGTGFTMPVDIESPGSFLRHMALDAPPPPSPPPALHSMPIPPPFSFAAHVRMVSDVSVAMSDMSSTASPFEMHSRMASATSDVSMRSRTASVVSDASTSRSASPIADVPAGLRCDSPLALAWAAEGENAVAMALGDTDATAAAASGIAKAVLDVLDACDWARSKPDARGADDVESDEELDSESGAESDAESDNENDHEDEHDDDQNGDEDDNQGEDGDDRDGDQVDGENDIENARSAAAAVPPPRQVQFAVSPAPSLTRTPLLETNDAPFSWPESRPAVAPEAAGAMSAVVRKAMADRCAYKVAAGAN
ncbi:hypothetical protein AMAG_19872 [Allomyces macrogynus ATCC 38327]|uniref:Uncharacterized protein n=1 Tax=Allomyces macrogynus (strain ATCC 38327) TaxID=578462 RepID=A0A0L0T2D5_ALLM3|nr:hypothetical protein AMAG_19872 [Allomyces macrogynus ATCC 38327]|eukprot:KNE68906.1 hypothetical protein AMAG_19872 [Allomyces macrogynus ATCC 38327]